jgi:hypothetical protein
MVEHTDLSYMVSFEGPGFTAMQEDGVDKYYQARRPDRHLLVGQEYINGFVAEEAYQSSELFHRFVDADGDVSVIAEVSYNDVSQIAELVCEMNVTM